MAESIKKAREPRDHQEGMTWVDLQGREWHGVFEMDSARGPNGKKVIAWIQIAPHHWSSPIDIPPQVVKQVFDDAGNQVFGKVMVDYRQWKTENQQGRRMWADRVRDIAKKMYPNTYGDVLKNPTQDLLIEAGPAPLPLEFIEAAEVGNKWALGIPGAKRPAWVTDDLLATRDALKRSSGWRDDGADLGPVDASKYPDADENVPDEDALEPVGVAVGAFPDADDEDEPPRRGAGGRFQSKTR